MRQARRLPLRFSRRPRKPTFTPRPRTASRFKCTSTSGAVFESQGSLDAALREYQEALTVVETRKRGALGPADSALAHRRMAGAYDRLGRFAQAEAHYEKALKLGPETRRSGTTSATVTTSRDDGLTPSGR